MSCHNYMQMSTPPPPTDKVIIFPYPWATCSGNLLSFLHFAYIFFARSLFLTLSEENAAN